MHRFRILSFLLIFSLLISDFAAWAENPAVPLSGTAALTITEVMVKNHATLRDSDGDFPDWIEIHNDSGMDVNLDGWSLSDRSSKPGLVFPAFLLPAGTTFVVYASGKDRPEELHAPFSLSADEEIFLRAPDGTVVSRVPCPDLPEDRSYALRENGTYTECLYPTPWRENTSAGYDSWQESLGLPAVLQINEVLVSDPNGRFSDLDGSDWVELKNVSTEPVSLSGWYLSDDDDNYYKAALPQSVLAPGAVTVVPCSRLGLSLNSDHEALFLCSEDRGLQDWLPLRDIPYGGSFGRLPGQNGAFFFAAASPGSENRHGLRRVSAMPVATTPDGFFDGSESVLLDLQAEGSIYYTFDTEVPTEASLSWVGPAIVPASCVIRAIAVEPGALPSRPLTLNYFIGESFSLPVVSLVTDNKTAFYGMYQDRLKDLEWSGNLSWYEDSGSFSLPCGISMHGDTSLVLRKKGLNLHFRGCYGQQELNYDLYGGGVTCFSSLVLRGGQDQNACILRNELCENLALSVSDHMLSTRSRYCVVYLDGRYSGIYALSEKLNEAFYANYAGVDKNSVTVLGADAPRGSDIDQDVFQFCSGHDMSVPENYQHFLQVMDVDSLIDWVFLEGFFANSDLTYGNLRFCRSSEDDGRWRFMFCDLDATLSQQSVNHSILLQRNNIQCTQVSYLFADLWANSDFRDRFLSRAAELLSGPLSNESVLAEIDRLASELEPEVARDFAMSKRTFGQWQNAVDALRSFITENDWAQHNVNAICTQLRLSTQDRETYFGS